MSKQTFKDFKKEWAKDWAKDDVNNLHAKDFIIDVSFTESLIIENLLFVILWQTNIK